VVATAGAGIKGADAVIVGGTWVLGAVPLAATPDFKALTTSSLLMIPPFDVPSRERERE
jgi:hypothetical protein